MDLVVKHIRAFVVSYYINIIDKKLDNMYNQKGYLIVAIAQLDRATAS